VLKLFHAGVLPPPWLELGFLATLLTVVNVVHSGVPDFFVWFMVFAGITTHCQSFFVHLTVALCGSFPRLMANGFAKKALAVLAPKDDGFNVFRRTGTAGGIGPTEQVSAHDDTIPLV